MGHDEENYPSLSHLSHRRKEYNLERFEKILERFDNHMDYSKQYKFEKQKKLLKVINKGYIID